MELDPRPPDVTRRDAVLAIVSVGTVAGLVSSAPVAAQVNLPANGIEEVLRRIMGTAKPADGRVAMDIADVAENGNTVPYTLFVESPMTTDSYVKALHMLTSGNPQPQVATFQLTPLSGRAQVSSRMRLARTQEVVAVAELSDGRFFVSRRAVKVTIGGCGG
jgi:sulfur-oxidizing protein SoxY